MKGRDNQAIIPSAIPEPSTWLLMGLGLAGLFGGGRRMMVRDDLSIVARRLARAVSPPV